MKNTTTQSTLDCEENTTFFFSKTCWLKFDPTCKKNVILQNWSAEVQCNFSKYCNYFFFGKPACSGLTQHCKIIRVVGKLAS
jgi:hypothetical protein